MPLPQSMLVAVCPADRPALHRAFHARAVHSASKGQHRVRLRPEEDVLLSNASLQLSLLPRTLVMTGNHATILRDLHDLRALPAIGSSRVDCPIPGNIGRRLLRDRDTADPEQLKR